MATDPPALRVGTWNVLSIGDEYDADFGCPLSIAICPESIESNRSCNRSTFTQQRQQRIWNRIESLYEVLDVFCLQEVQDDFLSLHDTSTSHWTMIHFTSECAIFLSNESTFQVKASFNVWLIPLTNIFFDRAAVPVVLLQSSPNTSLHSYLVGSLNLSSPYYNMNLWYSLAWSAILSAAKDSLEEHWKQNKIWVILAGDFKHNLTAPSNDTKWTRVGGESTNSIIHSSTMKEYNWMGNVDGFVASSVPLFASSQKNATKFRLEPFNVLTLIEGFMPKFVLGFRQGNQTLTAARFALASTGDSVGEDTQLFNESQLQNYLWNLTSDEIPTNLQVLFSESGRFQPSDMFQVVPNSNPFSQSLSDHFLVMATFEIFPSNVTDTSAPSPFSAHNKSDSKNISPGGWVIASILMAFFALVFWRSRVLCCPSARRTRRMTRITRSDPTSSRSEAPISYHRRHQMRQMGLH